MSETTEIEAFPALNDAEMALIASLARREQFETDQIVFAHGTAQLDFMVVEKGRIEILNPLDKDHHVAWHGPNHFAGDIDLLTGRPTIVSAVAREPTTILRIAHKNFRKLLNSVPSLSEKLLVALQARRLLLSAHDRLGLVVVGGANCSQTTLVREFLYKNFVPFFWVEPDTEQGKAALKDCGLSDKECLEDKRLPAIRVAPGKLLHCPSLRELGQAANVWQACPTNEIDFVIIGAGPAGMASAVYAASEGLSTLVLDRLGPGGQAGDSSKIENFIGFPSGLSGTELATRATLQMLKFGAKLVAPTCVTRIEPASDSQSPHKLHLDCGSVVSARVVLVAVGVHWRKLEAKNAWRFDRKGIYYACTSVESDVHEAQDVGVVGAGNSAGQAAMFLAEQCERTVHLFVRGESLKKGMSEYLSKRIEQTENIRLHFNCEVKTVLGEKKIDGVEVLYSDSQKTETVKLGALFVFIGGEPKVDWLPDAVARDDRGYVMTGTDVLKAGKWPLNDRAPCPLETSVPGLLAAGDIRAGSTKRVGFAVGDGSLAVTCAHSLLAKHR